MFLSISCSIFVHIALSCVDSATLLKTEHCFPNNKPMVTKDSKAPLNEKEKVYRSGDREKDPAHPTPPATAPSPSPR